ncbi:MAG TPA: hypothetical protein PLE61_15830 [Vicinamibacterales bacterium]|mgnify:CR=1 FL=1|nr:hypothetical protein [Vicinamibacterales bacterium]
MPSELVPVLTNETFLTKAGIAGVAIIAALAFAWLLLRYANNNTKTIAKMQVDAMDRQAKMHADAQAQQAQAHVEAMQTVRQSIDNNTATVRALEGRMGDFQGTLSELYGFLRHLMADKK